LCNGGLHQSSVLNFLLVKSGLWKTQSIDFSLKSQKSVTFCRFDQFFIENSALVLQLGVVVRSRRPLAAAVADTGAVVRPRLLLLLRRRRLLLMRMLLFLRRRRRRRRRQKRQRLRVISS
jgi:hypothetical protein